MVKYTEQERQNEVEHLKTLIPRGSTIHTVLRHVSQTGMSRRIDLYRLVALPQEEQTDRHQVAVLWLTGSAAKILNLKRSPDYEGLTVSGCGMDMGFHLVYELAHALYDDGYALEHRWL